jgi:pyruvate dehydrogenase E2 component (dihydrolipoamide acetyltransferase)
MANIIDMPKLSDTMAVGTLVKWLKQEGDAVKSGDMLAEVETDKATMELECFFDGTLLKIFTPAGGQVPIGAALCAVGKAGETVEAPVAKAPEGGAAPSGAPAPAGAADAKGGAAPAPGAAPAAPSAPAETASAAAAVGGASPGSAPAPAAPARSAAAAPSPVVSTPAASAPAAPGSDRVRISPLARKLAEEKGIDPRSVTGSGPGGRIVRADIAAAEKGGPAKSAKSGAGGAGGAPAWAVSPGPAKGPIQEEKVVAVSNMRATIARRLLESKTQIPHFYLDISVDAEPLLTLRAQLNSSLEKEGVKLSVNDFILKASAEALRRVPAANCSWEPGAGAAAPSVRFHGSAHVSFAVAIEDGLITPVIRDTHLKTVFAISAEAKSLAKLAKEKKLQPAQFTGGTFCVSNLGMMGVDRFCAIINPPNAAILAVGATVKQPVVKDGQIAIGQRMNLTLSCDHRVVDGAVGATYLAALKDLLEKPALLLL